MDGSGMTGTFLKRKLAPSALPKLFSVSNEIFSPLKNQSGVQLGPGLRLQVDI